MTAAGRFVSTLAGWWAGYGLTGDTAVVHRQVRVSELEAGFSLACTLAVCVHQEWGAWDQVGAAIAIPVAMAFSVHGLNNARGLGLKWGLPYLAARVAVIVLGIAYSYQHYYHFLGELTVFGFDLRPVVAVTMELLTVSALIAHEAHSTRLAGLTDPADPAVTAAVVVAPDPGRPRLGSEPSSSGRPVVRSVALFDPPMGAHPLAPTGVGSTNNKTTSNLNGVK